MKIALLGNPNTGKSSVFNMLTGLRQQVGNFPGVTVDKRVGEFSTPKATHQLIDFPGSYSLYARSLDEQIVEDIMSDSSHLDYPHAVIYVADAANLERNLLFFSQIYDLGLPCILLLNMVDRAQKKGILINEGLLQEAFPNAHIIRSNARIGFGKNRIIEAIELLSDAGQKEKSLRQFEFLSNAQSQQKDTEARLEKIRNLGLIQQSNLNGPKQAKTLDKILTHPVYGYFIFAILLLIIFQFIFSFATIPMDFIDAQFVRLSLWSSAVLPDGLLSDLISQGLIPGIGGVLVFVPQIAILFLFISLLEESGYLSRVVFIMDRLMRPFGLNGKSVVPLLSSVACAIPGIMSARTISDWKERLTTIFVAPFMSCSARIPVYTLLINLVIPSKYLWGFLSLQGLVLFGLYTLGIVFALGTAALLKLLVKRKNQGFHLMELPDYKAPRFNNVLITVFEKVKIFILDAGKIIIAISIILWGLATFGPSSRDQHLEQLKQSDVYQSAQISEQESLEKSLLLSESYIGHFGKWLEPAIQPLGYDWKIGVALLSSFAAREVFVGSLATIYSVGDDNDNQRRLIEKLKYERNEQGKPFYSLATGLSLLIFYVFAMQCMATLAVVKRETNGWKWPIIQLIYMGTVAYLCAFITFQFLS